MKRALLSFLSLLFITSITLAQNSSDEQLNNHPFRFIRHEGNRDIMVVDESGNPQVDGPSYALETMAKDSLEATKYSQEVSHILFNNKRQEENFLEVSKGKQDELNQVVNQFKSTIEVSLKELETLME